MDSGYRELTTYDIVSRGKSTSGVNQCWGTTTGGGSGSGYLESCIHSGTIRTSGDLPTTWYNYVLASAGTIIGTPNTNVATESVCPKGWTLPSSTQINTIASGAGIPTYVSAFSPVLGGRYYLVELQEETTVGVWWSSTASTALGRHYIRFHEGKLQFGSNYRLYGNYIRCVQKST